MALPKGYFGQERTQSEGNLLKAFISASTGVNYVLADWRGHRFFSDPIGGVIHFSMHLLEGLQIFFQTFRKICNPPVAVNNEHSLIPPDSSFFSNF